MILNIDMKTKISKPARLSPGDVIGIAAPAGPFDEELFQQGVSAVKDMGFEVMVPKNLQHPVGYLAGADKHRASLLNDLFRATEVKAIICARGGYGSMRVLDLMDFDLPGLYPKLFLGFSDISALISSIITKGRMMAFHGPNITTLGKASLQTKTSFYRAVTSNQPLVIQSRNTRVIRTGKGTGIVSGGNLATLSHLLGTPYAPTYKGCIFVMEDIGEAPYKIDRMLFQMKMAGCFKGVAGLILGSFHKCGSYGAICEIVDNIFENVQIPILGGFDIGHGGDNITIPMGIMASLDTDQGALAYLEAALI